MDILKLIGITLMGIYTFIKLYTNFLGDDEKYAKFQKANKRFGLILTGIFNKILKPIFTHPLTNELFLVLNRSLGGLIFLLGILYSCMAYSKYHNWYISFAVMFALWGSAINILYRGKQVYNVFDSAMKKLN